MEQSVYTRPSVRKASFWNMTWNTSPVTYMNAAAFLDFNVQCGKATTEQLGHLRFLKIEKFQEKQMLRRGIRETFVKCSFSVLVIDLWLILSHSQNFKALFNYHEWTDKRFRFNISILKHVEKWYIFDLSKNLFLFSA